MLNPLGRHVRRLALGLGATAAASLALAGGALADSPSNTNGPFVIGDQTSLALGTEVNFWGAQWWQNNPLSTGLAPAAFKGYVDENQVTCGQEWSTDPGNSGHPPATLPGVVPVIVSSQITQDGSVISGDTQAIVLVQVDPGYAGDPGHPGTGTIVGYVCGGPAGQGGGGGIINT